MKKKSGTEKNRIMILAFVMIMLIHASSALSAFAEEVSETDAAAYGSWEQLSEARANTDLPAPVIFSDEKQLGEIQQIRLPFPNVTEEKLEWDFPYSDEFFSLPSDEFSIQCQ